MRAFRGTETVKCGEDEFTLSIDIEIIDAIEDELDCGFEDAFNKSVGRGRLGKTTRLLHGLLQSRHPDLSLDDVGGLLRDHGTELGEGMLRLMDKVTPDPDPEAKGENPPKAHRGTGASSSSRGARPTSRQSSSGGKRLAHSS